MKTTIIVPNKIGFFCGYVPAQTIADGTEFFKLSDGGGEMICVAAAEAALVAGGIKRYQITPTADVVDELALPNTYLIAPGSKITFPVAKALAVWEANSVLSAAGEEMTEALTAELVWQDVNGIISSVSISGTGRNAKITVETNAAKGQGNGLVALKIDGTIFWSWHLWITEYDPSLPASHKTNNGFTFMDRNLGSWGGATNGRVVGTMYQ